MTRTPFFGCNHWQLSWYGIPVIRSPSFIAVELCFEEFCPRTSRIRAPSGTGRKSVSVRKDPDSDPDPDPFIGEFST